MLTLSKNPSRGGFESTFRQSSNIRVQTFNKMGCGESKCDCQFDEHSETVNAIRAHLEKQYLGPFHLKTTWEVVLIILGLEVILYGLYKLYLRRKAKRDAKKSHRGQYLMDHYGRNQQRGNHYQVPDDIMGYPGAPPRYSYPGQNHQEPPPLHPTGHRHQGSPPQGGHGGQHQGAPPPPPGGQPRDSNGQPQGGQGSDNANAHQHLNGMKK